MTADDHSHAIHRREYHSCNTLYNLHNIAAMAFRRQLDAVGASTPSARSWTFPLTPPLLAVYTRHPNHVWQRKVRSRQGQGQHDYTIAGSPDSWRPIFS